MYHLYTDGKISRQAVVYALAKMRSEWQETDADSLVDVEASVGLLLADLGTALGLSPEELRESLGDALYQELFEVLEYA